LSETSIVELVSESQGVRGLSGVGFLTTLGVGVKIFLSDSRSPIG